MKQLNQKYIFPKIFLLVVLSIFIFPAKAFCLDSESKNLYNKVMMEIFNEILQNKGKFRELKNFDQSALTTNPYGIYTFRYKFSDGASAYKKQIFEFGLTMVGLNDKQAFGKTSSNFDLSFPLLDFRFSGYQVRTPGTRKFDLEKLVQKYGQELWDYQQKYMPYQIKLTAVKNEYKVGEEIEFKVSLKNPSQLNFKVKDLSTNTLFFLYNNKTWGATEVNPAESDDKEFILKSGDSVEKNFKGPPIVTPQEFEIYVSYGLTYQGVKPSDSLKIKVVP